MTYIELRNSMKDFTVFSVREILRVDPAFHRRRLNEWQDKGYIRKVVKGFYIFANRALDEWALFEIANRIYKPSYVSLESALAHYQLIPESVYGITSVSTRRSYRFPSAVADLRYRTVKPRLYFGYDLAAGGARRVKIARPEKAILDFLYLNPRLRSEADFESLRIDAERFFHLVDDSEFRTALARFAQKTLTARAERFLAYLRRAG
jgi:predicted transcriptional regulator of viral defense system